MPFRRVLDTEAGPDALGILVPPGPQTTVVLRPRALSWDLLPVVDPEFPIFQVMSSEEASGQALRLLKALEQSMPPCEIGAAESDPAILRVRLGTFVLIVCNRVPGRPFATASFSIQAEGEEAVRQLLAVLHPEDREQEVYFNATHFLPG